MKTLFLALAFTGSLAAQAAEVRYGTYPATGSHASRGSLVAWSDAGNLHLGRVDARGQLIATQTIDLPDAELSAPAIATDGQSYLVVFAQAGGVGLQIAGVPVDAHGNLGAMRVYGGGSGGTPSLFWNGDAYLLRTERELVTIDRGGARIGAVNAPAAREQVVTGADAQLAFGTSTFAGIRHCGFTMCVTIGASYTISWTYSSATAPQRTGRVTRPWHALGQAVAATDGTGFVLGWNGPNGVEALLIRNGEPYSSTLVPAVVNPATTPSIASDQLRYLLVYESTGDIYGVYVGGPDAIAHPFPIATSGLTEERPVVTALARGRFLVTYKSGDSLVGRLVVTEDAGSPRRRSVR